MASRKIRIQEINKKLDKDWTIYWWSIAKLKDGIHEFESINALAGNPNIRMCIVLENKYYPWDNWISWHKLSINPGIKLEDIVNNPDKPWNWQSISENPNLNMAFILANPDKAWHWYCISKNPGIKLADIINNPDKPWRLYGVLENPNITMEYIINNIDKIPISSKEIVRIVSRNPGIKLSDIRKHLDLAWDWKNGISRNPNITINFVLKNMRRGLNMSYVLMNPGIKPNDLFKLKKLILNSSISENPNITMEFINANPDIQWDWERISRNPNIKIEDITANLDKPWDRHIMQLNPFTSSKLDFYIQHYQRHLAAFRIQQHWHRIRLDPRHPVGQRRLEREYDELVAGQLQAK